MYVARKELIIVLGEGTTNAKAVTLDAQGNVVAKFSQPLAIQAPRGGWVEQSGEVLIDASIGVIAKVVNHAGTENVVVPAISNQCETAMDWYRQTDRPLNSAIIWQRTCSAAYREELQHENKE